MADGLTAPQPGQLNFEIVRDAGVRVVTVPERSIAAAMRTIVQALRVVVEPSAAVTVAAMLTGAVVPGPRTGVVLSGSNVSRALLVAVLGDGEPEGLEVSA
jgi:threonine dehydratase